MRTVHIRSRDNVTSDSLSRLQVAKTRELLPGLALSQPRSPTTFRLRLGQRLSALVERAYVPSTIHRYQFSWDASSAFCERGESPLPAKTVVLGQLLTSIFDEGKNPSTVRAYLSAIAWSHNRVSYNLENLELSWKLKTYL